MSEEDLLNYLSCTVCVGNLLVAFMYLNIIWCISLFLLKI